MTLRNWFYDKVYLPYFWLQIRKLKKAIKQLIKKFWLWRLNRLMNGSKIHTFFSLSFVVDSDLRIHKV